MLPASFPVITQHIDAFESGRDIDSIPEIYKIPKFRRPLRRRDIENMFPVLRRRGRQTHGAFEALGLLANQNPE